MVIKILEGKVAADTEGGKKVNAHLDFQPVTENQKNQNGKEKI
jgi:hypothetical protein